MTEAVTLTLVDTAGRDCGQFRVRCLRANEEWAGIPTILDLRDTLTRGPAAPVQLLEEIAYDYEVVSTNGQIVAHIEPSDVFSSGTDVSRGRLEPKRSTGTLCVEVQFADGGMGRCDLEVRSRKLDYESDYRSMLLRIAREGAELVQSAFAPSTLAAFRPDTLHDPETVYQRFAFLKALLDSDEVRAALEIINRRPHIEHLEVTRTADPAAGIRATARVAQALTAPGDRQQLAKPVAGLTSLPRRVNDVSVEPTFDTVPNRFVRHVLTRWRDLAEDVGRLLAADTPANRRGRREAGLIADDLTRVLMSPAIRDAGRLQAFPYSNQVLQGRAGYREILEAFLLGESASVIDWDDADRLFGAGQRNVAELYEYWVFLELVRIVGSLPGFETDKQDLVLVTANGLSLDLRRTGSVVVVATGERRGTPVEVRLWFNRPFPHSRSDSWSVPVRPDCSIEICPRGRRLDADTWIHFDAKYKIHELGDILESEEALIDPGRAQRPISADLAKMHAYRDAIRRTAGAYVLYPGGAGGIDIRRTQYHEVLPGLGAFRLRPSSSGEASNESSAALRDFIEEVVDHVAAQGTASERVRYWTRESTRESSTALNFDHRLQKPPADTTVLVGLVKSVAHREWILETGLYNLRADVDRSGSVSIDGPELTTDLVVLYSSTGDEILIAACDKTVSVMTADQLDARGYPAPGGSHYFCLQLRDLEVALGDGDALREVARLDRDRADWARPLATPFNDIAMAIFATPTV